MSSSLYVDGLLDARQEERFLVSADVARPRSFSALAYVRFTPESGHVRRAQRCLLRAVSRHHSVDHFGSGGKKQWRHSDAQRLGSFEVDEKLVRGWSLHGKISRLLALENAIDIAGCASV